MHRPILIVVTGQPGAGKTTLAERLSREWYLPLVSRDRIKEGIVHTLNKSHEELTEDANLIATNAFFDTVGFMLDRGVSWVAEAAFQHRLWSERLPALAQKARIHMVICRLDPDMALDRFLKRGMEDPSRIRFHGDKGVRMYKQGIMPEPGTYEEPRLDAPTYRIDTTEGYTPSLEELKKLILEQPQKHTPE